MTEHTGDLQDKWTRRGTFTTESQIELAGQYIAQLKKEKEELRIECNRLYGIGQEYDEDAGYLREQLHRVARERDKERELRLAAEDRRDVYLAELANEEE